MKQNIKSAAAIIILIGCILSASISVAQNAVLRVFTFKGEPKVIKAGKDAENIRSTGMALYAKDKIKTSEGDELVLINSSGGSIKLNKAGTYSVVSLNEKIMADKSGNMIRSYLSFVWEEFSSGHTDIEEYSKKHMQDKGVVNRGCRQPIMLDPPWGSTIMPGDILFSWEKESGADVYAFVIYEEDWEGNELLRILTTDTLIRISTNSLWLRKGVTYYWSVFPVNDPNCARFPFTLMERDAYSGFENEFREFSAGLSFPEDMNNILKAGFYEKYGLYSLAESCYRQALQISPDNKEYMRIFALFLARTGKTAEAKIMMAQAEK